MSLFYNVIQCCKKNNKEKPKRSLLWFVILNHFIWPHLSGQSENLNLLSC